MKKFLILTVGSSHEPILKSIKENKADFIYFLCSDDTISAKGSYEQVSGKGNVIKSSKDLKGPDLPNIATLSKLKENQYSVHRIRGFDNLNDCYIDSLKILTNITTSFPDASIIVDYTGGTKSMTAGLASAALDHEKCEIKIVTGTRSDLIKVANGTELIQPMDVWETKISRKLKAAQDLIHSYNYAGASRIIEETAKNCVSCKETRDRLNQWFCLCKAFDFWDKFDHQKAKNFLEPYAKFFPKHMKTISLVCKTDNGLELVIDLILNAERRAVQERFDDAIGRLYRALELTAQTWLMKKYSIDTGDLKLENVPEISRSKFKDKYADDKKIQIGLIQSWDLISSFEADLVGEYFKSNRQNILNFLEKRNQSLFAHGKNPINQTIYDFHSPAIITFIKESINLMGKMEKRKLLPDFEQLPHEFE